MDETPKNKHEDAHELDLASGEEVLWQGRPQKTGYFDANDLKRILLTLAVGGLMWIYVANNGNAQTSLVVLFITALGLSVEIYKTTILRRKRLESVHYTLTNQNAWIETPKENIRFPIDDRLIFNLVHRGANASIFMRRKRNIQGMTQSLFKRQAPSELEGFVNIDDGEAVYQTLKSVYKNNTV